MSKNYDVGKSILLPYLLARKTNILDYIIISHFDTDHVGGILTIIEQLKVKQIIIAKQAEDSQNYQSFKKMIKEKNINVMVVDKDDKLKIEKDLFFDIIWPNNKKTIQENILNNNSIVCKLNYKKFSIIFTGDIEQVAEKEIIQENKNILNSTILKVAHHGSKSSSLDDFIKLVNPKISLIGVGKDNKFGHPNNEVIERLASIGSKIYRTDKMGEIIIDVDKNSNFKVTQKIKNSN